MTVSPDAASRREEARQRGRFGEQPHTAPELSIDSRMADAGSQVALIASRLHESIAGVRFRVTDGVLEPTRILPSTVGRPVYQDRQFLIDLDDLAAYAASKSPALDLRPVEGSDGLWDWTPTAEQRTAHA